MAVIPWLLLLFSVEDLPPVSPLPSRRPEITLGSLHQLAKLNDRVLDLWATVLKALPECRLLVFRDTLRGVAAERLAQPTRAAWRPSVSNCVTLCRLAATIFRCTTKST